MLAAASEKKTIVVTSNALPPDQTAIERLARIQTEARYFEDLASFGWTTIAWRIIAACAAYPLVVAIGWSVILFVMSFVNGRPELFFDPQRLFMMALGIVAIGLLGGIAAFVWAGLVTLVTLPVIHLAVWSMHIRNDWTKLGAFAGGLIAFVATLPLTTKIAGELSAGAGTEPLLLMCLVPGLATIVGQYGGARGGVRANRLREAKNASRRALIEIGRSRFNFDEVQAELEASEQSRFQFRISHLLWLGLWVSLFFTAVRLSGIPYELFLPLLAGWLLYQAATILVWLNAGGAVPALVAKASADSFHVKRPSGYPQFVCFTWNTQTAARYQTPQTAKSFHVKQVVNDEFSND